MAYAQALHLTVWLGDCLPCDHLARLVVDSVALFDLSACIPTMGRAVGTLRSPRVLLGLLWYGYATGVWSIAQDRARYVRDGAVPFHCGQPASRPRYPGNGSRARSCPN